MRLLGNLTFALVLRIHDNLVWIRIRIQEAQKHMDPTDPDPQHCFADRFFDSK
jgi:hypothetical protein